MHTERQPEGRYKVKDVETLIIPSSAHQVSATILRKLYVLTDLIFTTTL